MEYRPQTAPKIDTVEEVLKYVGDEFSAIAKAFNETDILRSRVLHVAPEKPREGMIATADGSNWNPGSGAGTYTYINGAWVLNSSGAGISAAADFVTATAQASLSAERVATDSASIDVNIATVGQMKWDLIAPVSVANGGTGQITAAEAIGELVEALTEDTTPDRLLDFVGTYDASADTGKKVALHRMAGQAVLTTGSMSGASLDLPLDLTGYSNFKIFKLFLSNVIPASDGATPLIRFSDDGGATFEADAADYAWAWTAGEGDASGASQGDNSDSEIQLSQNIGNAAGEMGAFEITVFSPAAAAVTYITWVGLVNLSDGNLQAPVGGGRTLVAAASTDIQFLFSAGNITSGSYTLVGIM